MLWNKFRSVEDKIKRSRHKAACVGVLMICGIVLVMVVVGICYVVLDMKGQSPKPVDQTDVEPNGAEEKQTWVPADGLDDQTITLPLLTDDGTRQRRMTVYSTTTVFVLPPSTTPAPPTMTTPPEVSSTVDPSSTAVMTGNMYCPDPQRPKVLTLCNWVHTPVPGMIGADEVLGTRPAASSAGRQSATNPFVTMRLTLFDLWTYVMRSVTSTVPSYVTTMRQELATDFGTLHLCAATTSELWEKSLELQGSLDDALKLVRMQQALLSSQEGIIESQRLSLEQMAGLLAFVQDQTAATRHNTTTTSTQESPKHRKVM
ncbi:hypothetical protein PG985_008789 [Apiospora marii]|uniref:Uncharacterized protein n=1 Tax=Apiospora marii TaxID=335849 RepID=A0ABR1R570_9PEZI